MPRLRVAILWHMHQPYYLDPRTGELILPWVRLHAVKDYLHMAEILADFPELGLTVNFAPSLLAQLELYGRGVVDAYQRLSLQPSWDAAQKARLLESFFSVNHQRMLGIHPPFLNLWEIAQPMGQRAGYLSQAYFRDLVAWFNLAWIEPRRLESDPRLAGLVARGEGYSRADIEEILAIHLELVAEVIPAYRRLARTGRVELSASPYHHPILPLLVDGQVARRPSPDLPLPQVPFAHPQDARSQIEAGLERHREVFGLEAGGMWPSEGAVSEEILPLFPPSVSWIASDEAVLARSAGLAVERDGHGLLTHPERLYRAFQTPRPGLAIVFRDRVLSDRIGFVYQGMQAEEAAADLVTRLEASAERLPSQGSYLAAIILDGENAWEGYADNGDPFLRQLYRRLLESELVEPVSIGRFLEEHPPEARLERLATGSWIHGNLETWIGEPAQNGAWEALARARRAFAGWEAGAGSAEPQRREAVMGSLHIAEGSDWFWWYYSRNRAAEEPLFDAVFRAHLRQAYETMGLPVPERLNRPLDATASPVSPPRAAISPPLEARPEAEGWEEGGLILPVGGSMRRAVTLLERLRYGLDAERLYLRLELAEAVGGRAVEIELWRPEAHQRLIVEDSGARLEEAGPTGWQPAGEPGAVAMADRVVEVALGRRELGLAPGQALSLAVGVHEGGRILDRLPAQGYHDLDLTDL